MKKIALAALALAASFTAAVADEMPIKGKCTNGTDTVEFNGSIMPEQDPVTGDFGTTILYMTTPNYKKMFENIVEFVPGETADKDGYRLGSIGELGVAVKDLDQKNGQFFIRSSTDNLDDVFHAYLPQWNCKINPNF